MVKENVHENLHDKQNEPRRSTRKRKLADLGLQGSAIEDLPKPWNKKRVMVRASTKRLSKQANVADEIAEVE